MELLRALLSVLFFFGFIGGIIAWFIFKIKAGMTFLKFGAKSKQANVSLLVSIISFVLIFVSVISLSPRADSTTILNGATKPLNKSESPASIIVETTGAAPDVAKRASDTVFGKNFSFDDNLQVLNIPASEEEKEFIKTMYNDCPDDPSKSCLAKSKFMQYAFNKFPDIRKIKFNPDQDIKSDPETYHMYENAFYVGLYYAKLIKLSNGESLFDFLKNCSSKIDAINGGSFKLEGAKTSIYLQYFPHLLVKSEGKVDDMTMIYTRDGDRLIPESKDFSLHAIRDSNFMDEHGLECVK